MSCDKEVPLKEHLMPQGGDELSSYVGCLNVHGVGMAVVARRGLNPQAWVCGWFCGLFCFGLFFFFK